MCFSSPSIPPVTPPPPVATEQDAAISGALADDRRRRAAMAGRASTILTGPQGVNQAPSTSTPKTLLGG